jgi:16S rRNA C967 or C1407 C5-methylase (RsmB/RsmF family)/NOL1/NOP2/fmu family ribosome biogenesis protein
MSDINGNLNEKFIERMKKQLPEREWGAFFAVYNEKPHKGVRVNALKCSAKDFEKISPFHLSPVLWEENGYYIQEEKIGGSPYHFAGVIYSQEPSAMVAAPLLDVKKGERVLDLCSAPGGKGTQLAAKMQGEGIIVMNEPVFSRAKILSQNVERMGVKNAVVVSEMPSELAAVFEGYFDKILVDAPCSGEGMFRKNADEALKEWSVENVALCANRQKQILAEAFKMLKNGGRLVYSTCTFSLEEDEGQVREFIADFPEMKLIREEKLYPHRVRGEGHYAAVLEKMGAEIQDSVRTLRPNASKLSEKAYREFEKDFFKDKFAENLHEANGILYAIPKDVFDWKGLNVLRVGVRLGEMVNGRFEPSHSLIMSAKASECRKVISLNANDPRLEKFLRGETIEADGEKGWCAVCVENFPIGLGKLVNGTVKNHIPKALRKFERE